MKHAKQMTIVTLLFLAISGLAAAQSLGDYARTVRKNKPDPSSTTHHYDNDNLPTTETLSVVGPAPAAGAQSAPVAQTAPDSTTAAAERQKAADEWNAKLAKQKETIDALNHELDLDQRELRLRTAAAYTDPTIAVRNVQWNKDDAKYKSDADEKQKALEAARQQLEELQEQAHKAGVTPKDQDTDKDKDKDKNNNSDNDKK